MTEVSRSPILAQERGSLKGGRLAPFTSGELAELPEDVSRSETVLVNGPGPLTSMLDTWLRPPASRVNWADSVIASGGVSRYNET
jgi:hypothetical protein